MSLLEEEIVPGAIAYLSAVALAGDTRVSISGAEAEIAPGVRAVCILTRDGPFVCVYVENGIATFAPITSEIRPERLAILSSWVVDGYGSLGLGRNCLSDGASTYTGPIEAFVDAGASERVFQNGRRPRITASGLRAVEAEIAAQLHRSRSYVRPQTLAPTEQSEDTGGT